MNKSLTTAPDVEEDIVVGGREQLFHLLAESAEIEHSLMCTYLYAAFSLKDPAMPEFGPGEAAAIARWERSIKAVAIDEMVHLLIVANLTIAIGGRPHFGRPNFPVEAGLFPADLVARLSGFSASTLRHFVFLERPKGSSIQDDPAFLPAKTYEREEAYHGLMPSMQDYGTVGGLYEAISANLRAATKRYGATALFVGPLSAQVGSDVVDLEGVATVSDLESALAAVDAIIEQGEGAPGERDDSHFQRFLSIEQEYQQLRHARPGFEPAWNVADNPVMRRPPHPTGKVFVDHTDAAPHLDFANAIHGLLLQLIVQSFGRTGRDAARAQRAHLDAAISLMTELDLASRLLARLPATREPNGPRAGMTFTMLRSVEPYFSGTAEVALLTERLRELATGVRSMSGRYVELAVVEPRLQEALRRYRDSMASR